MRQERAFALRALVLFFTFLCGCQRSGLAPGSNAPQFSLPGISGDRVSLADFKGKTVVLNFWATWCPPCIEELPSLEALYRQNKDKGFIVLAVASRDDADAVREMKEKSRLTMPVVLDEDGAVANRYKATGFPETFIIDREGKIRMFVDPEIGKPVTKAAGPRDWASPAFLQILLESP